MDVCYFYLLPVGPFLRQSRGNRGRLPGGKKASGSQIQSVLFCVGWILHKLFVSDPARRSSKRRIHSKNLSQKPDSDYKTQRHFYLLMTVLFIYAQLSGIAHVYIRVTCNHNLYACDFL